MLLSGAQIVAKFLETCGILDGFGVGGGYVDPLLKAVSEREALRFRVSSRESGAAYAADGYARAWGRPAFVVATAGPGETNAMTGVANADADSVPLLLLTGQVPTRNLGRNAFQESSSLSRNICEALSRMSSSALVAASAGGLLDLLRISYVRMLSGRRGPVCLAIPYDVQVEEIEVAGRDFSLSFLADSRPSTRSPRLELLAERLIADPEGILVVAGNGILQAKAVASFKRLLSSWDLAFVTTPKARLLGACGQGCYLGGIGLGGAADRAELLRYRTALILGSSLGELSCLGYLDILQSMDTIFQVDIDPEEMAKVIHYVQAVVGDLDEVMARLASLAPRPSVSPSRDRPSCLERQEPCPATGPSGEMHPGAFLQALGAALPAGFQVFADSGGAIPFTGRYLPLARSAGYHVPLAFAPMGWAIGAAVGAAAGDRSGESGPFICVTGEGSFLMEGFELVRAAEYGLRAGVVLLNNGVFNMPYHRHLRLYGAPVYSSFKRFELAPAMRSLGVRAEKVESPEEVGAALARLLAGEGPWLLEAMVDPGVPIPGSRSMDLKDAEGARDGRQDP